MYLNTSLSMGDTDYSSYSAHVTPPLSFTGNSSDLVNAVTIYYGTGTMQVLANEDQLRELAAECVAAADAIAKHRAKLCAEVAA